MAGNAPDAKCVMTPCYTYDKNFELALDCSLCQPLSRVICLEMPSVGIACMGVIVTSPVALTGAWEPSGNNGNEGLLTDEPGVSLGTGGVD